MFDPLRNESTEVNAQNMSFQLHTYVHNNRLDDVKMLLDQGADINMTDTRFQTPFLVPVSLKKGQAKMVQMLLKNGAAINIPDVDGQTPLHKCIQHCKKWIVDDILLNRRANVNVQNKAGETPLHIAVKCNNLVVVKELLDAGADINKQNNRYQTPLLLSINCHNRYSEMVQMLLQRRTMEKVSDEDGLIPVHKYVKFSQNLKVLYKLLCVGAEVNAQNVAGDTPLHFAVEYNNLHAVEKLCIYGADINKKNNMGQTPLFLSINIRSRYLEMVQMLLQRGALINMPDENSQTPLHKTVQYCENMMLLNLLLFAGAEVNAQDAAGNTALHEAVTYNNLHAVEKLCIYGADINKKNIMGETPLFLSVNISKAYSEVVRMLLRSGAEINMANGNGWTPLHKSVAHCENLIVLNILLCAGAEVNAQDAFGNTPLHIAVKYKNLAVVDKLLINGADINKKNNIGQTPLFLSIISQNIIWTSGESRHSEMVQMLLQRGALINTPDEDGRTPLHVSADRCENLRILDLVLEGGADVDALDNNGLTPLDTAVLSSPCAVVQHLLDWGASVTTTSSKRTLPLDCCKSSKLRCDHLHSRADVIQRIVFGQSDTLREDYFDQNLDNETGYYDKEKILKVHIVKLKTIGMLGNDVFHGIEVPSLKIKCQEEVEQMDKQIYNIFIKQSDPLYAVNKQLENKLFSNDFAEEFPIYCQIIRNNFKLAKIRLTILNSAKVSFSRLLQISRLRSLPEEVIRYMLSYMEDNELLMFVESIEKL